MEKSRNKGITLISLVITIIILLIIAGIAVYSGKEMIQKANLEELKTNMLLIEAKAKEYVEKANFKMGINPDDNKKSIVREEVYVTSAKLKPASESMPDNTKIPVSECYVLTEETLNEWGLNKIELDKDEKYLVKFDENNLQVEVYNTKGYNEKYSLTDIEEIEE